MTVWWIGVFWWSSCENITPLSCFFPPNNVTNCAHLCNQEHVDIYNIYVYDWQWGTGASIPGTVVAPPSLLFLFAPAVVPFTSSSLPSLHPLHRPFVPLSSPPGIFRYWSPHYSSIQPQQTHKQISCLRRSQSPSPSLLRCAIRPQHTPVRWARGKAYCRLQPPRAPPPNLSASQPCVTAAPNTIKSHLQNAQA